MNSLASLVNWKSLKFSLQALEVDLSAIGGSQEEHRQATELLERVFERHQKAMKEM